MAGEAVMVTDAGLGSSVAVIRSLDRAGFRVIAADTRPGSPGMVSRHASARWVYPPPALEPRAFLDSMERAAAELHLDLLIPVTDNAILPLCAERERLEPGCKLAIAETAALEAAADKERTARDARALGIPVPETVLVESAEDALAAAEGLGWPVVVKPRASKVYRKDQVDELRVTYAGNATGLQACMEHLEGRCTVMLQRYYPGRGVGVELLMLEGEPLLAFQHDRLREFPVHGGPGALRRAAPLDPRLYRYAVDLLAAWNWTGLAMVEFKVGEQGPWLMEVNGRIWGSIPLPVFTGIDFPAHYARMLLHGTRPSAANGDYRHGLRARNLENDLMWIAAVLAGLPQRRHPYLPAPRRLAALKAMGQLLNPAIRNDVQSWRDPYPGLVDFVRIARKIRDKQKIYTRAVR